MMDADLARVRAGELRAVARLLRRVDDGDPAARPLLDALWQHGGRAHVVGVTGPPGAGKSTLVSALIGAWRRRGKTVAVLAVDPSSPFTGGALLGDRVRMMAHAEDEGVFIRSVATRGALGGLGPNTFAQVSVLDAAGYDVVVVETVGVGQDEVDVIRVADSTVVVAVPGLGDVVQAMKAGVMEIADVFVVNKADRPGAQQTVADLRRLGRLAPRADGWRVPVLSCRADAGDGIDAVVEALATHRAEVDARGRAEARARHAIAQVHHGALDRRLAAWLAGEVGQQAVADVAARRCSPESAALRMPEG